MQSQQSSQFDDNQQLPIVLLQSPVSKQVMQHVSFAHVYETMIKHVSKMYKSNYYEAIKIHYGVKSKTEHGNAYARLYKREQEILNEQIVQENQYIRRLTSANSEQDLVDIEQDYQRVIGILNKRANQFDHSEFMPWIYVEAKKKQPLYGKVFQEFDRKGTALLKATLGYRSPLALFDRIEFNMETLPVEYMRRRKYYLFGLNWSRPFQHSYFNSDAFMGVQNCCTPIFKTVDERKMSVNAGITNQQSRLEIQAAIRYPRFFENVHNYCQEGLYLPSRKYSIKNDRTFIDTLSRGDVMVGSYLSLKSETTVPYLSQSSFLKLDLNYRKFFDLYNFSKHFPHSTIKTLLQNCNLETNLSLKAQYSQTNFVSDKLDNSEVRGFENIRDPSNSIFQAKTSWKLNNYNYPVFGSVGIVPFLFGQVGTSIYKNLKESHLLGSIGMGLSYPLGKFIQLEVLYCLLQAQNKPTREPINFQIRIGFMD